MVSKLADLKRADMLAGEQERRLTNFVNLVTFDADLLTEELKETVKQAGLTIYTFDEICKVGEENIDKFEVKEPGPHDCPMFSYTSGTTGDPKGVKLSH